ncbi:hypothetical protein [Tabrizicola sp.]|uniref:hypothetical protein n=1 Tax=Tabrizicola sp. TaxID=2005166 RepID=UPI001A46243A|nr:hypothetical protein [Tabrizicola sp.]MBL9074009.1 hypothetical protein [Tabrizicola sp.]
MQIGIQMLREAAERRVTSPAATDLTVDLRGTPCSGTAQFSPKPGPAAHWPARLCLIPTSIPGVTGPAPASGRAQPNWINLSRSSALIPTIPDSRCCKSRIAVLDRCGGLPAALVSPM